MNPVTEISPHSSSSAPQNSEKKHVTDIKTYEPTNVVVDVRSSSGSPTSAILNSNNASCIKSQKSCSVTLGKISNDSSSSSSSSSTKNTFSPSNLTYPSRKSISFDQKIPAVPHQASVSSLDQDLQVKKEMKYDRELEKTIQDWMEAVLGEKFSDLGTFAENLRNGQKLCHLLNAISQRHPPPVTKINQGNRPFFQRENIQNYLEECKKLGLPSSALFSTDDLFDEKNMISVINNLQHLAKWTEKQASWKGPKLKSHTIGASRAFFDCIIDGFAESSNPSSSSSTGVPVPNSDFSSTAEDDELFRWIESHSDCEFGLRMGNQLDAFKTLQDGHILLALFEKLSKTSVGFFNRTCSILWQRMQNVVLLLRVLAEHTGARLDFSAQEIINGDAFAMRKLIRFMRSNFDSDAVFSSVNEDEQVRSKIIKELTTLFGNLLYHTQSLNDNLLLPLKSAAILDSMELNVFDRLEMILEEYRLVYILLQQTTVESPLSCVLAAVINPQLFLILVDLGAVDDICRYNLVFSSIVEMYDQQQIHNNKLVFASQSVLPTQIRNRVIQLIRGFLSHGKPSESENAACSALSLLLELEKLSSPSFFDHKQKLSHLILTIHPPLQYVKDKSRFIMEGFIGCHEIDSCYLFLLDNELIICSYDSCFQEAPFRKVHELLLSQLAWSICSHDSEEELFGFQLEDQQQQQLPHLHFFGASEHERSSWLSAFDTCLKGQLLPSDEEISDLSDEDGEVYLENSSSSEDD